MAGSPLKYAGILAVLWVLGGSGQTPASGIDLTLIDSTIRPQDDLFRAANGRWLATAVVPTDRVTSGTFTELADKTESDLRNIIERVAADRDRARGSARQIADLYTSLMNQSRADELGLRPIEPLIAGIDAITTKGDLAAEAGRGAAVAGGVAVGGRQVGVEEVLQVGPGGSFGLVGERLPDRLGHKGVLRVGLLVEAAVGEADLGHDLGDADVRDAVFAEQPRRCPDDPLPVLLRLCLRCPTHGPIIDVCCHLSLVRDG